MTGFLKKSLGNFYFQFLESTIGFFSSSLKESFVSGEGVTFAHSPQHCSNLLGVLLTKVRRCGSENHWGVK